MFFMVDNVDIASYVDDNTPYNVGKKPMCQTFQMVP